jgi:hypothetical protein
VERASYLQVLLSVWVGLGLGQLVQSFHRLIRLKGQVKWHWLPVTWAGFAFLLVVQTWWAYFRIIQSPIWTNLFAFLLPLAIFVILYLICASAFPDDKEDGSLVDLESFYFAQRRYFFGLWASLLILALIVSRSVEGRFSLLGDDGFRLGGVAAGVAMAIVRDKSVHAVITVLAAASLALYIVLFTLRLG